MGDGSVFGELEDQVTCWICFEIFKEPITLNCSHAFCKECLLKIYKKNPLCAFCRQPFLLPLPPVNRDLEQLVKQFSGDKMVMDRPDLIRLAQEAYMLNMPEEVLFNIFSLLSFKDLCRVAKVCDDFHRIANDNLLWRSLCRDRNPFCQVEKYDRNWKRCFAAMHITQRGWTAGKPSDFNMVPFRGHTNYITCFQLYRNSVVSGSADSTIKVWDVKKKDALQTLNGHIGPINALQFNEVRIASCSQDCTVRLWDTTTGNNLHVFNHNTAVNCLQFDENKIVSASSIIKVHDIRSGNLTQTLNNNQIISNLQLNEFMVVMTCNNNLKVWDIRNQQNPVRAINGNGPFTALQALPTQNQIVTGSNLGSVEIWDINTGAISHTFNDHNSTVNSLQCDGSKIVTGSQDSTIKVFDLKNRRILRSLAGHAGAVNSVQFDDKKIVSGSVDNSLAVWNLVDGAKLYHLLGGSNTVRANNPVHPTKPGCSKLMFDDNRIVASFASLIRCYNFDVEI